MTGHFATPGPHTRPAIIQDHMSVIKKRSGDQCAPALIQDRRSIKHIMVVKAAAGGGRGRAESIPLSILEPSLVFYYGISSSPSPWVIFVSFFLTVSLPLSLSVCLYLSVSLPVCLSVGYVSFFLYSITYFSLV